MSDDVAVETLAAWWVSWYSPENAGGFTLYWPWWRSGWMIDENDDEITTVVAAIRAESSEKAMEIVYSSYDERPENLEFRFVDELEEESEKPWERENTRFPMTDWMEWK